MRRLKSRALALLGLGYLATLGIGCGTTEPETLTIPIGAVIDRTGTLAATSWVDAATLAVSDANQALEQSGRVLRFKLQLSDSTNTPKVAIQRALELVQQKGVRGIITDSSQDDIALNSLFYDADPTNDALINFDDGAITYTLTGFGGAEDSTVVVDPTDATIEFTARRCE